MKPRKLLRWRTWLLTATAGLPLFQLFSGCTPNIPGVLNVPGAVSFELQNLIIRTLVDAFSVIVLNVLNL
ncbi:MAG: hypothetical protein HUU22_19425 [Phycisphaerae bacterium]|nr:hypothetical protein [Phycisphaerae bacterium]NUQ48191.1 hypothetical protein [Phycisphaerae bacterium]